MIIKNKLKSHYRFYKNIYHNKNDKIRSLQNSTAKAFTYEWTTQDYNFTKISKTPWFNRSCQFWDTNFLNWKEEIIKLFNKKKSAPIILDAGCGAGINMLPILKKLNKNFNYLGVDVSNSVIAAKKIYDKLKFNSTFIKSSFQNLKLSKNSCDFVFAIGSLHHSDDILRSIKKIIFPLKKKGKFIFWVYKKQTFFREYSDQLIRSKITKMNNSDTKNTLKDITDFGRQLHNSKVKIKILRDFKLLGIKKGNYTIHNIIFRYLFKSVYNPILGYLGSFYENFDWYKPDINNTYTTEEIRVICKKLDLRINKIFISTSGIGIVSSKK